MCINCGTILVYGTTQVIVIVIEIKYLPTFVKEPRKKESKNQLAIKNLDEAHFTLPFSKFAPSHNKMSLSIPHKLIIVG